jgi:hypothetical protein
VIDDGSRWEGWICRRWFSGWEIGHLCGGDG